METKSERQEAEEFFKEAMVKWRRFIALWNSAMRGSFLNGTSEANEILKWFQGSYPKYQNYSSFRIETTTDEGKKTVVDPLFDILFRGGNFGNLRRQNRFYVDELNQVEPQLAAMASAIKSDGELQKRRLESPIAEVLRIVNRFHFAISPLKNRRKGKISFQFEDEYDVQDVLQCFLKLEFDDVRREEPTATYAGASSKIDIVLKNEKIIIETKMTRKNLTDKEIGDELMKDIPRYGNFPEVSTLVFFVYDPDFLIENPDGLKSDIEKLSSAKLKVIVIFSPKKK